MRYLNRRLARILPMTLLRVSDGPRAATAVMVKTIGRQDRAATPSLLGLGVLNEQLAILAIPTGLILGLLDAVPDGRGLVADGVHLLEGAVSRLGIEEVDDGDDEGVARSVVS